MDDALLAKRALGGDLDSFGQLYDRYVGRVYDFAWRVLRDNDAAAEVSRETLARALEGLAAAGKAVSFKAWLFTIAHQAAVARAEGGSLAPLPAGHEEAFGSFDVPDPARIGDAAGVGADAELGALIWDAATALNPRDYALLDLHVREGLEPAEIAGVIGVSRGAAATMVGRMNTAASDVISSYVVARRGSADCPELQQTLAQLDFPPYTDEVRKAVDGHITGCERCQRLRAGIAPPLGVLAAFAAVPAPMALKGDIWRDLAHSWAEQGLSGAGGRVREPLAGLPVSPYAQASAGDAAARDRGRLSAAGAALGPAATGFGAGGIASRTPSDLTTDGGRRFGGAGGGFGGDDGGDGRAAPLFGGGGGDEKNILLFAGAAVGLLLFAFIGGAIIAGAFGGGGGGGGATTPGATATQAAKRTGTAVPSITPGVAIQTPTPNLTPRATPTLEDTPTQVPPTAEPPTITPVPVQATPTSIAPRPTPGKATPTKPATVATPPPGPTACAPFTCTPVAP